MAKKRVAQEACMFCGAVHDGLCPTDAVRRCHHCNVALALIDERWMDSAGSVICDAQSRRAHIPWQRRQSS